MFESLDCTIVVALGKAVVEHRHKSFLRLLLFFRPLFEGEFQTFRAFGGVDELLLTFESLGSLETEKCNLLILTLDCLVEFLHHGFELENLRTLEGFLLETCGNRLLGSHRQVFECEHLHHETLSIETTFLGKSVNTSEGFHILLTFYRLDVATEYNYFGRIPSHIHLDTAIDFRYAVSHSRQVCVGNCVPNFVTSHHFFTSNGFATARYHRAEHIANNGLPVVECAQEKFVVVRHELDRRNIVSILVYVVNRKCTAILPSLAVVGCGIGTSDKVSIGTCGSPNLDFGSCQCQSFQYTLCLVVQTTIVITLVGQFNTFSYKSYDWDSV